MLLPFEVVDAGSSGTPEQQRRQPAKGRQAR